MVPAATIALACGFDFPETLLEQRESSLVGLRPADWLSTGIEDAVPRATDDLKANEREEVTTESIEQAELNGAQLALLTAMRASTNGAAAYEAGEGLPEAVRLYVSGAVEFKAAAAAIAAGGDAAAHVGAALTYFERVLQLPEAQRASRATWASYMAGRVERLSPDPAATERAISWFQKTRELALAGQPDPLGLAVASFGEEGRIALEKGDMPLAIHLYFEQAARGSPRARDSLRVVAERLIADTGLASRHVQDPLIRKLWLAGVLSEAREGYYFDRNGYGAMPGGSGNNPRNTWGDRVSQVTASLDRSKVPELEQLALVAYTTGRFDLAESLAAGVNTPIAGVVRAKLALRSGDRETAAKEYAAAVSLHREVPTGDGTGFAHGAWSRLLAESGALALSRGDYTDALRSMLESGGRYWRDAAYIAERVLTLDELTAFVGQHAQGLATSSEGLDPHPDYFGIPDDAPKALRLLLARRQMREQRFDEAIENFRKDDFAVDGAQRSLAATAVEYVASSRDSTERWTRVQRAEALFNAANLAKSYGMELMGYEDAPDYFAFNGQMDLYRGTAAGPYVSADEAARIKANAAPELRFHYRHVALDLAQLSADHLPARSQAFAAVLCTSLRWARRNNEPSLATSLYRRYVLESAYVGWSEKFGGRCEAPDFEGASAFVWDMRMKATRRALRPYKVPLIALAVAALAGSVMFAVKLQRAFAPAR
jgi:hypothetical protein